MGLFTPKKPALIGVDISSTQVRLLQLGQSGRGYRVEHYATEVLPAHAVVEKKIIEVDLVGEAIARALARSGSRLKNAAAAVAGSAVITRTIPMPIELSGEELEDQIQVEAEQYIPYPIDEVSLDYEILGPSPDNPEINEILLAASRTENVDICVAALGLGGLVAKVIDVEGFAVENACGLITEQIDTSGDALMAVINIGAAMTTLSVLRNRHTIYSREQSFRGQQFTEEMMRVDPLSSEEAEHAILQQGLPETHTAETLTPFKDSLVQQVSRLIEFFYSGSGYSKISQVVLSGDYASIEGIDTMLEEQLGVRCVVANPLVHMNLPAHQKESLIRDASALMVVTGLALRSFD